MSFVNQAAFNDPRSYQMAMGVDLRTSSAITGPTGRVLIHAQTGGMVNPTRCELQPGAIVLRFGNASARAEGVAKGGWWLEKPEFDKLFAFAQVWDIAIGMAMRALCLVPPEWSEATLLIRARVTEPLLAWRCRRSCQDCALSRNIPSKPARACGASYILCREARPKAPHQLDRSKLLADAAALLI